MHEDAASRCESMRAKAAEQVEKAIADETWRRAHEIVERHPHLDVSGVYHVLVGLRRSPAERLAESFAMADAYTAAAARE